MFDRRLAETNQPPESTAAQTQEHLQTAIQAITSKGNVPAAQSETAKRESEADKIFGTLSIVASGVGDIALTTAEGAADAALNLSKGVGKDIEKGATAAAGGVEDGVQWVYHNPGKTAAIVGAGAALVAATVATGGLDVIVPALATGLAAAGSMLTSSAAVGAMEVAGMATATVSTGEAIKNVVNHGELGVLFNGNTTEQQKNAARQQLKADTGEAVLNDLVIGAGEGLLIARGGSALVKGAQKLATLMQDGKQAETIGKTTLNIGGEFNRNPLPLTDEELEQKVERLNRMLDDMSIGTPPEELTNQGLGARLWQFGTAGGDVGRERMNASITGNWSRETLASRDWLQENAPDLGSLPGLTERFPGGPAQTVLQGESTQFAAGPLSTALRTDNVATCVAVYCNDGTTQFLGHADSMINHQALSEALQVSGINLDKAKVTLMPGPIPSPVLETILPAFMKNENAISNLSIVPFKGPGNGSVIARDGSLYLP